MDKKKQRLNIVLSIMALAIFLTISYLITRFAIFFLAPFPWQDKIIGIFLIFAEIFIVMHSIGYAINIIRVVTTRKTLVSEEHIIPTLIETPPVAVVIPSYKEPLEVLEKTLTGCFNLSYPNKQIILLDDTKYEEEPSLREYQASIEKLCERFQIQLFRRKWRGAKAGIINDYMDYIVGSPPDGALLVDFGKEKQKHQSEFLCIFDADQNPVPDFLEPLIDKMQKNERLAFVQTPQYYTNYQNNRVAKASGLQQVIFYEYICEGKSVKDAMFCCGTNVLFRIKALEDVGGFDEQSVTEDFATSLNFHLRGWNTQYYDRVGAFGMGPEDLGSYFKQQFRWALGTLSLFKTIIKKFFTNPKEMALVKWWEFFLSGSHYLIGFVYLIVVTSPMIYLIFGIPSYFADYHVYLLIFIPYIVITFSTFFWTIRKRGYKALEMLMAQFLILVTFPVYIKGAIFAFLGIKRTFEVTEKTGSKKLPIRGILGQFILFSAIYATIVWGIMRTIFERNPLAAFIVNIFWCIYNLVILSSIFYFNNPQGEKEQ